MKGVLLILICSLSSLHSIASLAWTRMEDFGGGVRDAAIGFSIGNYGYAGTGRNPADNDDFWQYDPSANTWTQKASYPGQGKYGMVGFSIGNYGYAGTGWSGSGGGGNQFKDFWQYDPANNTWVQKTDFGGTARYTAVGFAIANKGYVGLGYSPYNNDLWEYDPSANSWTQMANAPFTRLGCAAFGIGNKGYVGMGYDIAGNHFNDLYEFDPNLNVWTAKSSMPAMTRRAPVSFVIGNYGYTGAGYNDTTYLTDFYRYDPLNDQWTTVASIGGIPRYWCFGFSINNYGYVGTGSFAGIVTPLRTSDFWRFEECDGSTSGILTNPINSNNNFLSVTASQYEGIHLNYNLTDITDATFNLYNDLGQKLLSKEIVYSIKTMSIPVPLSNRIYFYSLTNTSGILISGKVLAQ